MRVNNAFASSRKKGRETGITRKNTSSTAGENKNLGSRNATAAGSAQGTIPVQKSLEGSSLYTNYAGHLASAGGYLEGENYANLPSYYEATAEEIEKELAERKEEYQQIVEAADNDDRRGGVTQKTQNLYQMVFNQMEDILKNFTTIDENGDGTVVDAELRRWLTA